MIIELSKDQSFKNSLLKANLDNDTLELVKSEANVTVIHQSLIDNINSTNIVEYRKLINKAEEENRAMGAATKKITDTQFKTLIRLTAELEQIPEKEVDRTKFPLERIEAKARITELRDELKTIQTIGRDEDTDESTADLSGSSLGGKTSGQKTLDAATESDLLKEKTAKSKARDDLLKASNWADELKTLIEKLQIKKSGDELVINRMAEFEILSGSEAESNQVIALIKDLIEYKELDGYLVSKYKSLLETLITKKDKTPNVLIPIGIDKNGAAVKKPDKMIMVGSLQERYNALINQEFLGFTLLEVLQEMHRKKHGKQPLTSKKPDQRKRELQDLQRTLLGTTPKDAARFTKLKKIITALKNTIHQQEFKKKSITDSLKQLKELENQVEELVARKIRKLMSSLNTLRGFDKLQEASDLISEIKDNPEKYAEELKNELLADIEKEEAKYQKVILVLESEQMVMASITRVSKAIRVMEVLMEDTGKDISGEIQRIFSNMLIPLLSLKRNSKKIVKETNKMEKIIEEAFEEWGLEDNKVLRIDSSGIGFDGVSDVNATDVMTLNRIKLTFQTSVETIDDLMNTYDDLMNRLQETEPQPTEEELEEQAELDELDEEERKERVEGMRNRKITQSKLPEGDVMADYDYGDDE